MSVRQSIQVVTESVAARSIKPRRQDVHRASLSCGNLAHGCAACSAPDKVSLSGSQSLNLGIVTSYNDMLSAHQPYGNYPELIKDAARSMGATAQVAGCGSGHVRWHNPRPAGDRPFVVQ